MPQALIIDRFDSEFAARTTVDDWQRILVLRNHPRFLDGILLYNELMPELFANNIILNKVVNEITRIQMIAYTLHLYDAPETADPRVGLTLSRLQKICLTHDLASAGGVTAFLGLMRIAGYVHKQRSDNDKRVVELAPTAKFIAIVEQWTKTLLLSIDAIEPGPALVPSHAAHPRFGWDMRERGVQLLLRGWKPLEPFPETQMFLNCQGGWMLLLTCLAETIRAGSRTAIVPISVDLTRFGKRFGVSRSHLRRTLETAHENGLLDAAPRNGSHVLLSHRMVAAALSAQASELANYRLCARAVQSELGLASAGAASGA